MARKAAKGKGSRAEAQRFVAQNRKARRDFVIEETFEAGVMLMGSEVKGLRAGGANLNEAYARVDDGDLWLINAHIPEYKFSNRDGHTAKRPRKLLLHKRELEKVMGAIKQDGATAVPLSIYFNDRGIAKVELGLARGRRQFEKRELDKKRDWQREQGRLMRDRG
ncbi:MAG: SsrA-binding protein [Alphaproteobacteria bacterium]|jgi:SsrA-binding protein